MDTILAGLDAETRAFVHTDDLEIIIAALDTPITPAPELMFEAFRACPLDRVRVVLLGQDPYPGGQATGMSFSVDRSAALPPSLMNIYKCLHRQGLIDTIPEHGDLTAWARQGVLMLNCALTTVPGKSNAHAALWRPYTDDLCERLGRRGVAFIALGGAAQKKVASARVPRDQIFAWGHPSPLNAANRGDTPANFIYCDAFTRVNDGIIDFGAAVIDWNPDTSVGAGPPAHAITAVDDGGAIADCYAGAEIGPDDPAPPESALYVFTDGGCIANGKPNCVASWAFYLNDGVMTARAYGMVPPVDIIVGGKHYPYRSSNNRGELTAVLRALQYIASDDYILVHDRIVIVSDSKYVIDGITIQYPNWVSTGNLDRLNVDLFASITAMIAALSPRATVVLQHQRGHSETPDIDSPEYFEVFGNDTADYYCNIALGRKNIKKIVKKRK